ncbi:putative peptidase S33 family protein [Actinoplanes sp. N902-109]|nr:putative peptidase S33 family protein [Actinoplanes sp. N902-109]
MVQMYHQKMAATLSAFSSDSARIKYQATERRLIDRHWPRERTEIDVPTSYGSTHVIRSGAADGVPFVLLPGSGGGCLMWFPHVTGLGRDRPVYAIDPIGEPGLSTQTAPITDGADWSRWFTEVLDGLGVERAHVVGCSYGGWVALRHHLDHPERAASITLLDPGGFGRVTGRFLAWIIVCGIAMLGPAPARRLAARIFRNATLRYDEVRELGRETLAFRRRLPLPVALSDAELRRVQAPTLALLGQRSQMYDANAVADRMRRLLPDVRTMVIPGASHDLPLFDPPLIMNLTREFANGNAPADGNVPQPGR